MEETLLEKETGLNAEKWLTIKSLKVRRKFHSEFSMPRIVLGILFLIVTVSASGGSYSGSQKDDSQDFFDEYRNEEGSMARNADVKRLLAEYPENQRFIRSLESQFYQITYPQQLQRHGKGQGISTRDATKVAELSGRKVYTKTNHVHRTSYRIKAFSHIFTVDLELNTQLLASNVMAFHRKLDGSTDVDHQIERCYYHGSVKDYSGAIAAFRTCNGLAGIIQLGNETLIVSPMAGAEKLAKQPHFVIEAKSYNIHQKCGTKSGFEFRSRERPNYQRAGLRSRRRKNARHRFTRDIRSATKYVETALFLDKKFMELRNYSKTRAMHDALQIANIADLYFKTINTRITISYLETWSDRNLISLDKRPQIATALRQFYETVGKSLQSINKDTSHLITGEHFEGGESGMGVPSSICTPNAAGISVDLNVYEPHLVASTMAHMIGHNLHMDHDDGRQNCYCQDWHGCLMAKNVVGQDNVQPSKFSKCSIDDYHREIISDDNTRCLLNSYSSPYPGSKQQPGYTTYDQRPGKQPQGHARCGNGRVDIGEHCDCGPPEKCNEVDPCCDPITCQLRMDAECATGPCCEGCKLKPKGTLCRGIQTECDIPEYCDGTHGTCPMNIYMKNGNKCGPGDDNYCFNGICPTIDEQCKIIWGFGGRAADTACFAHFNVEGVSSGNCGKHKNGSYIKCDVGDILCGTLQCQNGAEEPVSPNIDQSYSKTVITLQGKNYKCKTMTPLGESGKGQDYNLVRDGTTCGEKLICVNQTCVSLYPFIEQGQCRTNNNALECSGNGVCSNMNTCYCKLGWTGDDCSVYDTARTTSFPHTTSTDKTVATTAKKDDKKDENSDAANPGRNTKLVGQQGSDTVFLVVVLVSGVGGVFFVFAFMALCYRSVAVHNNCYLCFRRKSTLPKYDPPYMKPIVKKPPQQHLNPVMAGKTEETSLDMANRIITFGNMPSYSNRTIDSCREHKMQPPMKRQMPPSGSSQSDEEALHSDELRTVHHEPYPRFPSAASTTSEFTRLKSSHEKLVDSGGEEDPVPPVGPIRIRNLEDLIRQLEHNPNRHMSPSGSEEIRMSETEADRHYRLDTSSCTESQGRGRGDPGGMAFVYGRYRQPPGSVASGSGSTSGGRSSDRLASGTTGIDYSDGVDSHGAYTEEDDMDHGDGGDAADSESDDYQPRPSSSLLRSASEEALPVTRYEASRFEAASPTEPYTPPSEEGSTHNDYQPPVEVQQPIDGSSGNLSQRATETVTPARYPEYKH